MSNRKQVVVIDASQGIDPVKLDKLRARLQATLGRNVTWSEIARGSGISNNTICNIRGGRTTGSMRAGNGILAFCRSRGLDAGYDDLFTPLGDISERSAESEASS